MKRSMLCSVAGFAAITLVGCGGGSQETSIPPTAQAQQGPQTTEMDAPELSATQTSRSGRPLPTGIAEATAASCQDGQNLSGGRSYRVEMPSRVDGAAIVFQVFEPTLFDCQTRHPLILQGHGFSGSRSTEAGTDPLAPIEPLVDAGYAVISIDQRGHGESGGTIRVMDPDLEGQDLVQIVDWAEANLDYLKYQQNNLVLGSVGGSYGGGFQYLLYNVDPDKRIDAMVPHITWHDLTYSLNPGDVTKNYWLAFLSTAGDSKSGLSMDPYLRSSLLEGIATSQFPQGALDFLHYHSPSYFWQNERNLELLDSSNTDSYLLEPITAEIPLTADGRYLVKTPPRAPYPVDVLMFQGMRDSLFPFNEAAENYRILSAAGGDVRLLTYPYSHHYLAPNVGLIQETLANLAFYSGELPTLAGADLNPLASCGSIDATQATVAWFNEKLLSRGNADNVITTGQQICYTLAPGDAVSTPDITVGGISYPVGLDLLVTNTPVSVLSGPAGTLPTIVPMATLDSEAVLAGIPTATLTVSTGLHELDSQCLESSDPVLQAGTCDAIVFVGVGVIRANQPTPELIDEQVLPLRGLGDHEVELTGIAERLQSGDQLVLMLYGQHPTFAGAFSRDLAVPAVQVSGSAALPLLSADGQRPLH
ncbi:peptidase S15 [Marinobacter sp. BW6]|uniref:alpha/beta fold hydrolase n=1 Tax=Marinobacter sp. BW6 TaxID=2592624 RepID=UPI0011DE7BFA|nr:alpha/beta fold hydrolase [Marinobacter sp. BW6]TYC59407.1 peptidase S15 [Marinobacter sp. BW6]